MMNEYVEFNGKQYDLRHGGPFDRGSADSYYCRGIMPHYYVGDTLGSEMVSNLDMTVEQIEEYVAGYNWNEQNGDRKQW